jgi:hypothetical protein
MQFKISRLLALGAGLWMCFGLAPLGIRAAGWVPESAWPILGQIGDNFGAANALFSSLALIAALYAVHQGHEALKLQRQEYELTRAELARTADAQRDAAAEQQRMVQSQIMAAFMDELSRPSTISAIKLIEERSRARGDIAQEIVAFRDDVVARRVGGPQRESYFELIRSCKRLMMLARRVMGVVRRGIIDLEFAALLLGPDIREALNTVERLEIALNPATDRTPFEFVRDLP